MLGTAVAGALVAVSPAAAADLPPARATVFTRGYDTSTKLVTLTMDADWYTPGDVPRVLQILRDNGITAGFALTGRYAERYPDQARAIVAAGHKLINHSYDHPYFTQLTRAQRFSELDRAEAAYNRIGLTSDGWFRAPYRDGYVDPGVTADLAARGYFIGFDWTFDTTGYLGVGQDVILDRVRRYTVPGATVLMHLSSDSTDTAALPQVIATLRSMGYGFTDPYRTVTTGSIAAHYAALGAQRSALGPPRTGEMVASVAGTAVQWFRTGRIYWRGDVGAHEVHGAIAGRYVEFGSIGSFLGFPVTDETTTPDGLGRFNHFVGGGSIYWTPVTGAHEVHGWIRVEWAALGWERGILGYPVGDEVSVVGGRASAFQKGTVYWSAATGAHEVHGAILGRYLQLGGTASRLRLPLSDEYTVAGGRRSDFQGGSLSWNAATGAVTVLYR
ncbi:MULTISPECIES: polysaccharide deacetylase family protein [unclassified Pseudonocardia]|uniref:polysaccharide deacetylase family protein n=1 Tax=unclassified Pseudonocardia TaxID=2619320 RepID=UPI0009662B6D|nr:MULTISPECIES: polysaccharide deacetylase family protein [unclassified Pseudonocardia]MBN9098709.1 polysaccharide deacetylase family protein [Pseudonocardia sp.]OJY51976.1 MAG: hypothetical protein BGP03_07960 [Pseudonocardia sp. 73-21]